MAYEFDKNKDEALKEKRGLGLDDMARFIDGGHVIAHLKEHKPHDYPGQDAFVVDVDGYAWIVPHESKNGNIRLITCYPSRKATKQWRKEYDPT